MAGWQPDPRRTVADGGRSGPPGPAHRCRPEIVSPDLVEVEEGGPMSFVTDYLTRRGTAFEVARHPRAVTSLEEARALGISADEVAKTVALATDRGYALLVLPASRRLDLRLAREAVGDHGARLATEEELQQAFANCELGALPPLGS